MGESSESVCVEEREGDDTVRGASRAGCRRRLEGVGEYNPTWFGVVWCEERLNKIIVECHAGSTSGTSSKTIR